MSPFTAGIVYGVLKEAREAIAELDRAAHDDMVQGILDNRRFPNPTIPEYSPHPAIAKCDAALSLLLTGTVINPRCGI